MVIKSRMMRWVGYVARIGAMRNAYKNLVGKLKARGHSEELSVDLRKIWWEFIWIRIGTSGGFL
jgi:hypothetical protein